MAFTRESALSYLSERHLLTKQPDEYSTSYVKRLASAFQKQEQAGEEPSRAKARGHRLAPVEKLSKVGHTLEQRRITRSGFEKLTGEQLANLSSEDIERRLDKGRDLDIDDLKNLFKKTKNQSSDFLIAITGIGQDSPTHAGYDARKIHTYSYWADRAQVAAWLAANPAGTIQQFANDFSFGLKWEVVLSISFVYPEGK